LKENNAGPLTFGVCTLARVKRMNFDKDEEENKKGICNFVGNNEAVCSSRR